VKYERNGVRLKHLNMKGTLMVV